MPDPKQKPLSLQTPPKGADARPKGEVLVDGQAELARLGSAPTLLNKDPVDSGRQSAPPAIEVTEFTKAKLKEFGLTFEKVLGQGGMGAVYLCTEDQLDRKVAVKVMLREFFNNEEVRERFIGEAKALAKMQHPNIITIHGLKVDKETGDTFIVMEYLKGANLYDLLEQKGPMEWSKAQAIFGAVCSAIESAHAEGIIHRDIKPDNIFIIGTNGSFHVKVLDFGLAKMENPQKKHKTKTGDVFGSPEYMAPEQAMGEHDLVDARSDIYSLGSVLYHILTGSTPFPIDMSKSDVANWIIIGPKILREKPEAPRDRAPQQGILLPVQDIIMKCLEKKPEDRFQSVRELMDALEAANLHKGPVNVPIDISVAPISSQDVAGIVGGPVPGRGSPVGMAKVTSPADEMMLDRVIVEQGLSGYQESPVSIQSANQPLLEKPAAIRAPPSVKPSEEATQIVRLRDSTLGVVAPAIQKTNNGRKKWLVYGALAATIMGGAGGIYMMEPGRGTPKPAQTMQSAEPPKEKPASLPSGSAVAAGSAGIIDSGAPDTLKDHAIGIHTEPSGVDIFIGDSKVGRTEGKDGATIRLPEMAGGVELIFRKKGYIEKTESVVPDGEKTMEVSLEKERQGRDAPNRVPRTKTPPAKVLKITNVE